MEPTTIGMVCVGILIGVLAMSNYRLRQEVHALRNQVRALVDLLVSRKVDFDEYDREALGRLGGKGSVDATPSGLWYRGH